MLQGASDDLVHELVDAGAAVCRSDEDLMSPDSAKRCIDAAISEFGRIDAAWIRTGLVSRGNSSAFLESDPAIWEQLKRHDIDRLIYTLRALLPHMVAAGAGQVVVSTSAAGLQPMRNASLYGASRAAAIALVRSVGLELAATGVTINAIATAFLDVPLFLAASGADTPEGRRRVENGVPMRRLGGEDEFAEFAMVLLDGRSRFQTGQCFSFSGGWSP
jgi:3-oxoacyl-[acyl-carrier protein] reductase